MKKTFYLVIAFVCCSFFTICCEREQSNSEPAGEANPPSEANPPAVFVIVKFDNPEQVKNIIVQHPIKGFNSAGYGCYEYDENMGLYLNILKYPYHHNYSMDSLVLDWLEKEMHIAETSPYIPLSKGYYMIDWKWQQLLPVSASPMSLFYGIYPDFYAIHIQNHVFIIDKNWDECRDLATNFDSINAEHLKDVDITRVFFDKIDTTGELNPYTHFYRYQYQDNVMFAYLLCRDRDKYGADTYIKYIHYYDSLQAVYQQRLIEIIAKDQLKEIGF